MLAHCLKDNDNMMVCANTTIILSTVYTVLGPTKLWLFGEAVDYNNIFSSGGSEELCGECEIIRL